MGAAAVPLDHPLQHTENRKRSFTLATIYAFNGGKVEMISKALASSINIGAGLPLSSASFFLSPLQILCSK
jgi:hypothetical protein